MAATQAETQSTQESGGDRPPSEHHVDSRTTLMQNGTDKAGKVRPGGDGGEERPPEQYAYRGYPDPGGKGPRGPPQRFMSGQSISQPSGPTPTLNSLLQSGGGPPHPHGPPHRYPNNYEQPPSPSPNPYWAPPRPMPPYSPQPYRNPSPSGGSRIGGAPYGGPPGGYPGGPPPQNSGPGPVSGPGPGLQQPYSPYPPHQRYPPPAPHPRPPYSPHQMEQGPSPQPSPGGAPSSPGHPPSASPQPPHSPHQHYPPRPGQATTPNTHDPEAELSGQNSNDSSSGGGGGGGSREALLRPSPSPTGSTGSRSMSPAVGQQNIPMPPRPSSSQSEGGGSNSNNTNSGVGGGVRSGVPGLPPGVPPGAPGPYPPPPHHQPYKMPPHHQPYPPPQHQYPPQGPYPPRPPYPNAGYGGAAAGAAQYGAPGRPPPPGPVVGGPPGGPPPQGYPGWGGARGPPPPPPHYLKQHLQHKMGPPAPHVMGPPGDPSQQDNGPPATALVTTGPDGAPLDDGSQQSTLSNASAASGEENVSRRGVGGAPSPGAASHASGHDDYDASPSSWPRTQPSSPVFNSHVPQENYRTKQKSDSLGKLYEMDSCPERRGWVERLLSFMEERRTPIAACPTISKQPLDLYRLYLYVRDRGGFVEVTKNKTWKDIAGLLGIGASSSAAYTLRKHYTKNLLPFECHYDRGGIDPQPIINQVEATTKKKSNKNNSVPSPGSSNSQDSFPGGGPPPPEGYGPPYSPYPTPAQGQPGGDNMAASNPFEDPQPRRNHQPGYPGGSQGYGYDQYGGNYPPNRPVYPPYGPEGDNRGYPATGGDPYSRYGPGYGGSPGGPPRGYAPPPPGPPAPPQSPTPPPTGAPPVPQQPGGPPPPQEYYRSPQPQQQHEMSQSSSSSVNMNSQLARQLVAPLSPARQYHHGYGPGPNKPPQMAGGNAVVGGAVPTPPPGQPPVGVQGQPRRHPDFSKEPPPGAQPPYPPPITPPRGAAPHHQYGGWNNNNNSGQYRGQFSPAVSVNNSVTPGGGQWAGPPRAPAPPGPAPQQPQQPQSWGPQPYPQQQQPPQPSQQWGPTGVRPNQTPPRPTTPYRPDIKPYPMSGPGQTPTKPGVGVVPKREITFPADSVEGVTPVTFKRRRITKVDVAPVEAWRIMMALKSGLLAETCWALDLLNILLFDDSSVVYFGLQHLPGLLDLLLEHFQKSLAEVFDPPASDPTPWYLPKSGEENPSTNCTSSRVPEPHKCFEVLKCDENYTSESRKGKPVIYKTREDDLFAPEDVKDWDLAEEQLNNEVGIDPWQFGSDASYVNHVLPCFQGEFIDIPFARIIEGRKETIVKEETLNSDSVSVSGAVDDLHTVCNSDKESQGVRNMSNCLNSDSSLKKGRTKASLADVISRVKNESDKNSDSKLNNGEQDKLNIKEEEVEENGTAAEIKQNGPTEAMEQTESCDKESTELEDNFTSEPMEIEKDEKPVIEKPAEKKHNLKIQDPAGTLKRRPLSEYEDECYTRDEASLYLISESHDSLARRCMCLSNILRNLTFVPGNETEFSKSGTFLALMGKLLLLHHEHPVRAPRTRNYDREEDAEWKGSCSSLGGEGEWWWEVLQQLREDALVCCANIGGQVELSKHPEQVARPVLDGLLHWAVCPSAQALDPLPALAPHRALSPRRLALEALCKICVTPSNVDLVVATPPFPRLQQLCAVLAKHLCRSEDQVLREFSVNLLHYLAAADSAVARVIAANNPTVSLLVAFIEQAEQSALGVANQHGIGALRDNPDSMGTSLDMLRRAASTLLQLSRHPDNKPLFVQQEQRLLSLVMSQILDQKVAAELSKVLFQCSRSPRTRNDF